jgi:predicted HNH restriction endonuclease
LDARTDDLIVVYQKMGRRRFLTHLVQPIDDEVTEFVVAPNFQYGRLVRTIAYTGKMGAIQLETTPVIDLVNSFGYTIPIKDRVERGRVQDVQNSVWSLFEPLMKHGLGENSSDRHLVDNDELERDFEGHEGRLLFRQHRLRERDSRLTAEKKRHAQLNDQFHCAVCHFSFLRTYGETYIECHHTMPISKGERISRLEDLALVCSNCHRMLHRLIGDDFPSVDQLRQLIAERS